MRKRMIDVWSGVEHIVIDGAQIPVPAFEAEYDVSNSHCNID